jgi:hypothetical protein
MIDIDRQISEIDRQLAIVDGSAQQENQENLRAQMRGPVPEMAPPTGIERLVPGLPISTEFEELEEVFGARTPDTTPDGVFGATAPRINVGDAVRPDRQRCSSCASHGDICNGRDHGTITVNEVRNGRAYLSDGGFCPIECLVHYDGLDDDEDDGDHHEEDEEGYEEDEEDEDDGDRQIDGGTYPSPEETDMTKKNSEKEKIAITAETIDTACEKLLVRYRKSDVDPTARIAQWIKSAPRKTMVTDLMGLAQAIEAIKNPDTAKPDMIKSMLLVCSAVPRVYAHADSVFHGELEKYERALKTMSGGDRDFVKMQLTGMLKNFHNVEYIMEDNCFTVDTEDCIAKGINFGPFRVTTWVDTGHLRMKAIKPNIPPGTRNCVHPHIDQDGGTLCLGDGANSFFKAIQEKRICDALLIVRGVLNQYSGNPYHHIEEWKKPNECIVCGGRGEVTCIGCRKPTCREHSFTCVRCGSSICFEHVKKCRDCDAPICGPCRRMDKTCGRCGSRHSDEHWSKRVEEHREAIAKRGGTTESPKKANISDAERLGGGFLDK